MRPVVLVTGASGGIGAEFARQLAGQDFDLVLVARSTSRLQELADRLQREYAVSAMVLTADLSTPDGRDSVAEYIRGAAGLTGLVNNAGFAVPEPFVSQPFSSHQSMIDVHITAATMFCHAALPGMNRLARENANAPAPFIINVASVAAFAGAGIYAAAKLYQVNLSRRLARDNRAAVRVQALCPGYTRTGFHSTEAYRDSGYADKIPGFWWLTSPYVVRTSLRQLRRPVRRVVCVPSLRYKAAVLLTKMGVRQ